MNRNHIRFAANTLILAGFLSFAACSSLTADSSSPGAVKAFLDGLPPRPAPSAASIPKDDTTAMELVRLFGVAWNLGNTLDSYSGSSYTDGWIEQYTDKGTEAYERAWGNPVTSPAVFEAVKEAGFGAVRIPVTWGPHMDAAGKVDGAWMERVAQVVDMALSAGLYAIINVHHDTGTAACTWLKASAKKVEETKVRFAALWAQIAGRFRDYDRRLLFEGYNEIIDEGANWGGTAAENFAAVNGFNQTFVDTVRSSGGQNGARFLVVNTYAASTAQEVIDAFVLPKDSALDRLIVQVHDYGPTVFTWHSENVGWAPTRSRWIEGTDSEEIRSRFDRLWKRFVARGIPVILGEFCADNKDNLLDRMKFAAYTVMTAKERGIACFWWDSGGDFSPDKAHSRSFYAGGGLLNRYTMEWAFPELSQTLVRARGE